MASDKFKNVAGFVGGLLSGIAAPGMGRVAQNIMSEKDRVERRAYEDGERARAERKGDSRYADTQARYAASDARAEALAGRQDTVFQQAQAGRAGKLRALKRVAADLGIEVPENATPEGIMTLLSDRGRARKEGQEDVRAGQSQQHADAATSYSTRSAAAIEDPEKIRKQATAEILSSSKSITSLEKQMRDLQVEAAQYQNHPEPLRQINGAIKRIEAQIDMLNGITSKASERMGESPGGTPSVIPDRNRRASELLMSLDTGGFAPGS